MKSFLTKTEDLICRYKCFGLQRKEIAARMNRSENTLIAHNRNIHHKLNVNNDIEVVVWYIENVLEIPLRKMISVVILLAIMIPSMLADPGNMVRAQRSSRSARIRTVRQRESDCFTLEL